MIIGHPGGLNGAALMGVIQLHCFAFYHSCLSIIVNLHQFVVAPEKKWLNISLINMAACPLVIPHGRGVSHFQSNRLSVRYKACAGVHMCGFYINHFRGRFQQYSAFVQVGHIAHHTDLSVCVYSDGLYLQSPMNAASQLNTRTLSG